MARRKYSGAKKVPFWKRRKGSDAGGQGAAGRHGRTMARKAGSSAVSEDTIIGFLYVHGRKTFHDMAVGFGLEGRRQKEFRNLLNALCHAKVVACAKDDLYSLKKTTALVEGEIAVHPQGYGFVAVLNPPEKLKIERDVFVPREGMATAMHGDRVLLRLSQPRRGRMEGQVVSVLQRATTKVVGIYMAGRETGLVIPEDERFAVNIVVRKEQSLGAANGEAVVAEIVEYMTEHGKMSGRIVEVLGDPENIGVQTQMVIRKFDLPHVFDAPVLEQAAAHSAAIKPQAGRADLREIPHVTIDGEDARDFDDAVAVMKTRNGFRLYVSIADVSYYVTPGSPLDQEAYKRGTSVYFPSRVLPMLPEHLSNNLCSLVPEEDRFAFTAILDFDGSGRRRKMEFTKSIIRSQHRLTYTVVKNILVDKDAALRRRYKPILTSLRSMEELAARLEQQRQDRGSIGFELPEAKIAIGKEGEIEDVGRMERNLAHKMIEEFMLSANEAVAEFISTGSDEAGQAGSLYRIHEPPDPAKVSEFIDFASSMGMKLPGGGVSPGWFGKILHMVAGTPREYLFNNLLLRTMQQARYAPDNVGHFGLAAEYYTHFTSPIRRYPDLMVHRALHAMLQSAAKPLKKKKAPQASPAGSLTEAGVFLSKRERVAVDAEREMVDRLKVRFMEDKVGETFGGIISGVTSFGMFVELLDFFVSGAVAMVDLTDDYYHFDEKSHRLIGKSKNKIYQVGGLVKVRVASVNKRRRHVNFVMAEEEGRSRKKARA